VDLLPEFLELQNDARQLAFLDRVPGSAEQAVCGIVRKPRMKRRKILLSAVALVLALLGWLVVEGMRGLRDARQLLTLLDGTQYVFAGVTWGTNHSAPSLAARLTDHLPWGLDDRVRKKYGTRWGLVPPVQIPSPALMVWMRPVTSPSGGISGPLPSPFLGVPRAILADGSGQNGGLSTYVPVGTSPWLRASFPMVPRRSRMLEVHFYQAKGTRSSGGVRIGSVRFRNPLFGRYPQWNPESLPSARMVEDLNVELAACGKVSSETQSFTESVLNITSGHGAIEPWEVVTLELSDATGNRLSAAPSDYVYQLGTNKLRFPGAFWPDENALRLKAYLKRRSGFASNELVTFTNVPLPKPSATNGTTLTKQVSGSSVQLRNFWSPSQRVSLEGLAMDSGSLTVSLPGSPEGMVADFVSETTDTGEKFQFPGFGTHSSPSEAVSFGWKIPPQAKFLNVTVAVQKMRTVEFLVKPQ
jgi:hypothetical protein